MKYQTLPWKHSKTASVFESRNPY